MRRRTREMQRASTRSGDALRQNMLGIYQALNERYASNTTLQWQIPLYAIPAQAALFVGIATSDGVLSIFLGITAAIVGFIGAVVMRRIELTARWDRQLLDDFEAKLIDDPSFHLLHNSQFKERIQKRELRSSRTGPKRIELALMRLFPPSLTVMVLLILVGGFALVVGVVRSASGSSTEIFGTPANVAAQSRSSRSSSPRASQGEHAVVPTQGHISPKVEDTEASH